jgi:nucleoside-diphosphate-sugar epimerase
VRILVSGGASYIGSWLVPHLLAEGHQVTVYDTLMFGNGFLPGDNENLTIVKADVRDHDAWRKVCVGTETVIYLASISRELMCQQQPELAQAVNVDCFDPDVRIAKEEGVKRFIYASSVAVYGSSETPLAEDSPLAPTTIYGIGKKACEEILRGYQSEDFTTIVTRSASVCGYAPRMRLDLTINRMVHDAMTKGIISVEGGDQIRSHIHIKDICDFYKLLLKHPAVGGRAFNVVCANQSIKQSAKMVQDIMSREFGKFVITPVKPRVDDRSYAIDGSLVAELGWTPNWMIHDAVRDVAIKFASGYWKDSLTNPIYQNMTNEVSEAHSV